LWGLDDLKTGNARKPFFLAGIEPECPIAIYPLMTRDLIKVYYDNFGVG
jgi:hypothetical protein